VIEYDRQFEDDAGEFYVPDTQRWFTFAPNKDDAWGLKHELTHKVDTIDGYRCAVVRKGVAYVAVDENEHGYPVLERWTITKRRVFHPA
jgi:transglutaminase-like putative cysteine protease